MIIAPRSTTISPAPTTVAPPPTSPLLDAPSTAATSPDALRPSRPLLATMRVEGGSASTSTRMQFAASITGTDWGSTTHRGSAVAVYVDGRYHSTVLVVAERNVPYAVNLGGLAPGSHDVELRAATDLGAAGGPVPTIRSTSSWVVTGDAGLVDRHAPIVELRDGARSALTSDVPLLLVPTIRPLERGRRLIEYRVIFSNEDAGTSTSDLYARNGRGVDVEPIYRVIVDEAGEAVYSTYQGALHFWHTFNGARENGRALLRVSTRNNMVAHADGGVRRERWSDAALPIAPHESTEFAPMRGHGWVWSLMAKELVREGKAVLGDAKRGAGQIGDPRHYVYLGPVDYALRGALETAGGLEVVLFDGRTVIARTAKNFARGSNRQTALELPLGISADMIRGVSLLGVKAIVLDREYRIRELLAAAASTR